MTISSYQTASCQVIIITTVAFCRVTSYSSFTVTKVKQSLSVGPPEGWLLTILPVPTHLLELT